MSSIMESAWFPFAYHYILGTALFVFGMWGARQTGALDLETRRHRRWAAVLVLGLIAYMVGHAAFQALP